MASARSFKSSRKPPFGAVAVVVSLAGRSLAYPSGPPDGGLPRKEAHHGK